MNMILSPSSSSLQSHEDHLAGPDTLYVYTECSVVSLGTEICRPLGRGRPRGRRVDEDNQRNHGTK